jgi:LacI family transcriptional regulator
VRDLDCPSVLVDNRGAARDATEHLLGLGHRRIAFVEGPPGLHTSAHRLEGFEAAIAAAGAEAVRLPGGFEYEAGAAAADELLASGDLPDAALGVNDEVAIGLLTGLRRGGIDVPGRVSVAGIDDTRPARLVDLTSVSLPLHELGEMAARVILEGAEGDIVLPHRLVARATTAARA